MRTVLITSLILPFILLKRLMFGFSKVDKQIETEGVNCFATLLMHALLGIFRFQHCLSNFLIHFISSSSLLDLFRVGGGGGGVIRLYKSSRL